MILKKVKPLKQKIMMCGPASLEIVLKYYKNNQTQKELKKKLNSTILMGTTNVKMVEVAQSLGFNAQFKFNSSIKEIKELISNKIPPIIGWFSPEGGSHYSVVNGIDEKYIYIVDPKLDKIRKMEIEDFSKRWLDINWENLSTIKKFIDSFKVKLNNIIHKKENYKLPLGNNEIIHREIIIIKPN